MWRHVHTLRFRIASLYTSVFTVILAIVCAVTLAVRAGELRETFDERLGDRAEVLAETIALTAASDEQPLDDSASWFNRLRFPGYYFQLRSADGAVLERSSSLGDGTLPLSDKARAAARAGKSALETIGGDGAKAEVGPVRMLTRFEPVSESESVYLQVAARMDAVNESVRDLRNLLLMLVASGLLVAAVTSWLLADRALAPLQTIAEKVRRLTASNWGVRLGGAGVTGEVGELATRLDEMVDRLRESFEAQERFMMSVSHELKTPLAVLLGEAQVLLQKARTAEEHERFITGVQDEARSLARIVDSLLTLARAEAGVSSSFIDQVSVNEAVMDAVTRCQPIATQQEVKLIPKLALAEDEASPPVVSGDGEMLRLMMGNLIRNAVRYSPAEGAVEIEVAIEGRQVFIAVRDRGPGIPAEYIDRVFDRFFQVPQEDRAFRGAGLGLTIVRGVARLHGGTVTAANRPEGGTEFKVCLPLMGRS